MPVTERYQKTILFEEAAKRGLTESDILNIPEAYQKILGVSDIGIRQYGNPLTPVYTAKTGELIDIGRIAKFFVGLARDYKVIDFSATELENSLNYINYELWARMQLVKNRAKQLSLGAQTERLKVSTGAVWAHNESFSDTNLIDMETTTAWIDTSEGIAFLPMGGTDQTVPPADLNIISETAPEGGNFLGSSASMAFDGLNTTNWRASFVSPSSVAGCIAQLRIPRDITAISLDPVGFGIDVLVEVMENGVWQTAIKAIIYSKRTFPVERAQVTQIRVTFTSVDTALPKASGIREIVVYSAKSERFATIYSRLLRPAFPFTEVRVELDARIPNGAKITPYFSTDNTVWTQINPGDWKALDDLGTTNVAINQTLFNQISNYRGIYGLSVATPSISEGEGLMEIGLNQIEVATFRKDWIEEGEAPHLLSLSDFSNQILLKTWTDAVKISLPVSATNERVIQNYGEDVSASIPRGTLLAFQRMVTEDSYNEFSVVPLLGNVNQNTMQFNHNYRMRFHVYANQEVFYENGRYWFLQGYRQPNTRNYREISKSYGSFALYINGELVAGDTAPYTIYTDGSVEVGGTMGRPLTIKLSEGWNVVELCINVLDPSAFYEDVFESGEPYLQISMTPSFFDPVFQHDVGITKILASGQQKPSSEFDLIWNLPKDLTYWAWSEDRQTVLFNSHRTNAIDGFFNGSVPSYVLSYRGTTFGSESSNLYVRLDLEREESTRSGPILDNCKVLVR
jgi:hypothetical protein